MTSPQHIAEAHERGRQMAIAAASWTVDGNTKYEAIAYVVSLLDAGDPAADDYLPARPDLSGQWAGDPTPLSLARDITGEDDPEPDVIGALADAFEAGVDETFDTECERVLRAALEA